MLDVAMHPARAPDLGSTPLDDGYEDVTSPPPTLPVKHPSRQSSLRKLPTAPSYERPSVPSATRPSTGIHQDVVAIKNLQLPFGVIAPDVWGKPKEQPALVSVTLLLRGIGFGLAAQNDVIAPGATIHYGDLAKRIRGACTPGMTAGAISRLVESTIVEMGMLAADNTARPRCIVARASIELNLPKAAMFGSGITLVNASLFDERGRARSIQRVFTVNDVKVMTLVGVHAHERTARQPIVASLWLFLSPGAQVLDSDQTVQLFNVEQILADILQETAFETLESLAEFTVAELQTRLLRETLPGAHIQLRLEKPRAIAFADAPAVEILREIPGGLTARPRHVPSTPERNEPDVMPESDRANGVDVPAPLVPMRRLNVIRPYIS